METLRTHELKIWPQFFAEIIGGIKTYEVRVNDRAFQIEDVLVLREWEPDFKMYTGRSCKVRIRHITDSATWYMIPNHLVVMGIELIE